MRNRSGRIHFAVHIVGHIFRLDNELCGLVDDAIVVNILDFKRTL